MSRKRLSNIAGIAACTAVRYAGSSEMIMPSFYFNRVCSLSPAQTSHRNQFPTNLKSSTVTMTTRPQPTSTPPPPKRRRLNPKSNPTTNILSLPDDALRHIFSFLCPPAARLHRDNLLATAPIAALAATCTHLRRLTSELHSQSRILDLIYPGYLGAETCLPGLSSEKGKAVECMVQSGVRVLRLPAAVDQKALAGILRAVAYPSCSVREVAFEDGGRVNEEMARCLSLAPSPQKIEVLRPGRILLQEMARGIKGLRSVVLRETDVELLQEVRKFFRLRAWRSEIDQEVASLDHVSVGIRLKHSNEGPDDVCMELVEEQALFKDFLQYLEQNASTDLKQLRKFALVIDRKEDLVSKFLARMKNKYAHGSSCFAEQTEVEVEQAGRRTVVPAIREMEKSCAMRDVTLQAIMSAARHAKDEYVQELLHADTLCLSSFRIIGSYEKGGEELRKKTMKLLAEGGGNVRRLKVEVGLNNYFGTRDFPGRTFHCVADLLHCTRNIATLEISNEIVEWTHKDFTDLVSLLRACENIEVLHLTPPDSYMGTRRRSTHERKVRFVRRLPLFLELLSQYCPRLQHLYLEDCKVSLSPYDGKNVAGALRKAKEAVEAKNSFGVCTVKAQVEKWIRTLN